MVSLAVVLLSGCAYRQPNPVSQYNPGDEKKSCQHLQAEMAELREEVKRKVGANSDTSGNNIALGVAGAFFIVPWFFMDLSDADKVEAESMVRRYNALRRIALDKQCPFAASAPAIKIEEPKQETKAEPDPMASDPWGSM